MKKTTKVKINKIIELLNKGEDDTNPNPWQTAWKKANLGATDLRGLELEHLDLRGVELINLADLWKEKLLKNTSNVTTISKKEKRKNKNESKNNKKRSIKRI